MKVLSFLSNAARVLFARFNKTNQMPKINAHSHFYKQGFMNHEVDALRSIFHSDVSQTSPKHKQQHP